MNERIKEFMRESGVKTFFPGDPGSGAPGPEGVYFGLTETQKLEKFAELIVGECIRKIEDIAESSNNPQPIYRVAVDLLEHFGVEE
jgi:hypothetical protein